MSTRSTCSSPPPVWNASREPVRLLALRDDGRDVAEHVGDAQAADVLREIAPVRADVAERRRGAALVGLEPPRVVGVLQQPVLQVLADEEVRRADVAARDRVARLLDQRVAAIVEGDGVDDAGLVRLVEQLAAPRRRSSPAACPRRRACPWRSPRRSPGSAGSSASRCGRPGRPDRRAAPRSCRRPARSRAPPPSCAPRRRCCRRPRRRRRSRGAAPRRCDAGPTNPAPTIPIPIRFTTCLLWPRSLSVIDAPDLQVGAKC